MSVDDRKYPTVHMDFHSDDSHKSMSLDNLSRSYRLAHRIGGYIQRMDYPKGLVHMNKLVDDCVLHSGHSVRMNHDRKPCDMHDLDDRMLHHRDNLRCIDKYRGHKQSMDFLAYQLDIDNWLCGFERHIQHHGHIGCHRMCMD